ncbi:glycoside hydrolase family 88 protein [Paenibacillus sp. Soil766]
MKLKFDTTANDLRQIAGRVADYTFGMDLTWDWPGGVAFYGVSRLFEVTGERAYLERMAVWCDEYIDAGIPGWTVTRRCQAEGEAMDRRCTASVLLAYQLFAG